MSVKILDKQPGYNVRTCDNCGTVFSYDKSDEWSTYSAVAAWWGDDLYSYYVTCPKCKHNILLRA